MRNLVLLGEKRRSAEVGKASAERQHVACDLCQVPNDDGTDTRTVLLTSEGTLILVNECNEVIWKCELGDCCDGDCGPWFSVTVVDPEQIVCLSKGGAIVTVSPTTGVAEVVGEFENGLEAGQWSPDREVLLLVTFVDNEDGGKNSVLLSMSSEWEVLAESTMEAHVPCSQKDDSLVSVCWRPDATLCAVSTLDVADQTRRIRTYKRESLALHSVGRSEDGSGKVVPNLLPQIAWASIGCSNLLTSIQRKGKRAQQVVFFEPNGLRHREFPLRPEQPDSIHATVLGLDWNIESDLLAVVLQELEHDKVQLWHRSNYHWYLKYEIRYRTEKVTSCKFDEEQPYILFVGVSDDVSSTELNWREYSFQWDTSTVYTTVDPSAICTALSIDGGMLNLTPLDKALVPPPMYASSVRMDCPIREVAFTMDSTGTVRGVVLLSDGSFAILVNNPENKSQLTPNYSAPSVSGKATLSNTKDMDMSSIRQVLVVKCTGTGIDLVAVACGPSSVEPDRLVELRLDLNESGGGSISIKSSLLLEGCVIRMAHWLDNATGALIQIDDGSFLEYVSDSAGHGQVLPSPAEPLLEPCPWMSALHDASKLNQREVSHRRRLVVGLSARLRLYCHDRLLADASSSFVLSKPHQFLCFATADARSTLKFLPLTELYNFDPLMGSDENYLLEGFEPRNLERGTRLVAILPMSPMAVLQMPRGNLEGIYPRALVLPYAMTKIDEGHYGEAFVMMRRQKLDLNLIVDLDPIRFLKRCGVDSFLEQVVPVDHLNLFISCLHDADITQYRYRVPNWFQRKNTTTSLVNADFDFTTKVNQVCRKLRSLMLQAESDGYTRGIRLVPNGHFLLPVLSTFAKESPPKLEEALTLIKNSALSAHPASSRKPPLFGEKAQSSIQYLAFLADYKMLFETALGMYDFELARAVARNSQMDPKVYLALLKRLKSCPEFYGKHEVDIKLGRFEAALSNLVRSGRHSEDLSSISPLDGPVQSIGNEFEHCMVLIESHGLHRLGLELFKSDNSKFREVMRSLGNKLLQESKAKTALSVFLAAEPPLLDGARKASRQCRDWQFFFSLPPESNGSIGSDESVLIRNRRIAKEIAEEVSGGRHAASASRRTVLADAARILLDYCQDVSGAVDMLISAELWSEGRRVAYLHSRNDLVRSCVDAAMSYAASCLGDFEERTASFKTANERYAEVLKIRKNAIRESGLALGEERDANLDDAGSLFSMASNASLRSNMTASSVGSVDSSVSSVISVGTQSTFSITPEHDVNKHKSKFNKLGKEKKKKKKRVRNKRARPGSEEELKSLVGTLRWSCVDTSYCEIIAETINFLVQVGKLDLAHELFEGFQKMKSEIASLQTERMDLARNEKEAHERKTRREGADEPFIVLDVEGEVDGFRCAELPDTIHDLFFYLP